MNASDWNGHGPADTKTPDLADVIRQLQELEQQSRAAVDHITEVLDRLDRRAKRYDTIAAKTAALILGHEDPSEPRHRTPSEPPRYPR